jgi:hypothetical protein
VLLLREETPPNKAERLGLVFGDERDVAVSTPIAMEDHDLRVREHPFGRR